MDVPKPLGQTVRLVAEFATNALRGRVSHRGGTALGGHVKVIVEGKRSAKKDGEVCVTGGNI